MYVNAKRTGDRSKSVKWTIAQEILACKKINKHDCESLKGERRSSVFGFPSVSEGSLCHEPPLEPKVKDCASSIPVLGTLKVDENGFYLTWIAGGQQRECGSVNAAERPDHRSELLGNPGIQGQADDVSCVDPAPKIPIKYPEVSGCSLKERTGAGGLRASGKLEEDENDADCECLLYIFETQLCPSGLWRSQLLSHESEGEHRENETEIIDMWTICDTRKGKYAKPPKVGNVSLSLSQTEGD
ncbi:hypothetical protein CCH79_00011636 [Gambusia affinis]|uniref:Uncharacterized protein n=1 Tax=Gambusia affinis TaxID=33528 RepID=A0A315VV93_GAMAF|nr:hypothetical protein CCH79_00011636 [Gambusia affinis]